VGPVPVILEGVLTLFQRVVLVNAVVLVGAGLMLALSPATVSEEIQLYEALILCLGGALVLGIDLLLVRRVFHPLEALTRLAREIDPLQPGRRVVVDRPTAEVAELCDAVNEMLDRLERERRESGRRALEAQEEERRRVAHELHDEVGQTLTAVLLGLDALGGDASPELRARVASVESTARAGVEQLRQIARGLRPEALDDFGLRSALVTLASSFGERSGLRIETQLAARLDELDEARELVVYRVAQEALTNVARHAGAGQVLLAMERAGDAVVLRVRDDGRGIDPGDVPGARGIVGMRERALLVGATLTIRPVAPHGTEVELSVPLEAPA
jgi:two-component system sensor histidine kinase UhpB